MSESKEANPKEKLEAKRASEKERKQQKKKHRALGSFLGLYLSLPLPFKLLFLLFGLLYSPPMVQNLFACIGAPKTGRLRAISGPDYIFFYVAGIWGLLFSWFATFFQDDTALSWLYISILLFTYVTIGLDFKGGAWIGVVVALFGLVAVVGWIGAQNEIPIVELIGKGFNWFALDEFPRNFVFTLSLSSLFVYLIVYIRMNIVNVLKIEGNYVQVWTLAARSPKDTRASFSIVPDFDDINEAFLGFSCRLNLKSKSSRIESHEFANMPGGPVVEHISTHLLNAQEVQMSGEDLYIDDGSDEGDDD